MKDVIGWSSSVVLLFTIASQVQKQWRDGTSEGVSRLLYVGQILASVGFTIYSALVRDTVFIVTNSMLLVSAVLGLIVTIRHETAQRHRATPGNQRLPALSSAPSGH